MSKLVLGAAGLAAVTYFAGDHFSLPSIPPMLMVLPITLGIIVGVLVVSTR